MPKINTLSPKIIAKIAAGEVVERPASVVKELVENSLDANASLIQIEIENGGLKKICVVDNGHGMSQADLKECFKKHTTSKIQTEEDLSTINTLGFRGEALYSIASVSSLSIKSKLHQEPIGNYLKLEEREIIELHPIGLASGTQIMVENLFKNTPARKKFLKSDTFEFQQILNFISKLALVFPQIGFKLTHNNKTFLELPQNQSPKDRVAMILGKRTYSSLIPLNYEDSQLRIKGFIGTPQLATRAKNKQYIFVNHRLIKNSQISSAIKEAFGNLLEARAYPVFLIHFELKPENLDVNIHPRKEEIKFLDLNAILETLKATIKEQLSKVNLTYKFSNSFSDLEDKAYNINAENFFVNDGMEQYTAYTLKNTTDIWSVKEQKTDSSIFQIHKTYLIKETEKGLLIVDQHAAHERILYEQFLESFEKNRTQNKIYQLEKSIIFDLPINESSLLMEKLDVFIKLGFDIEPFGNNSFKINTAPEIFKNRDLASLIAEVLGDLEQGKLPFSLDLLTDKTIAFLACRSAIKAGDYLTDDERARLFEKLSKTSSNYTCPHGRPVMIELSTRDLHSLFKRV